MDGPRAAGAEGGGDDGQLRDPDPEAERGRERDPRVGGLEAERHRAVIGEHAGERVGQRAAGDQAEPAGDERDEQRLVRDQPAHLTRAGAERAQHGGLAPALGDRQRERAGDDEQRDGAGQAAHRAEDCHHRLAVAGVGVARIGIGGVVAVEHVDAAAELLAQPVAQGRDAGAGLCEDADRRHAPGRPGQAGGRRVGEEQRSLTPVAPAGRARQPAHADGGLPAGGGDPQRVAGADAEARVGHDLARAGRRAAGGEGVGEQRGAREAVAAHALAGADLERRAAGARTDRERHVADRPCDTGDALGAVGNGGVERRRRNHVRGLVGREPDRRIGAHDGVGSGEAARAGGLEGARHQHAGRGGERDGEPDRHKGAGQRGAAGADGLPGDAQHG